MRCVRLLPSLLCIRLLAQLINEETKLPNTSDETLLSKMNAAYGKSSAKENPYLTDFRAPTVFTIKHYAGHDTFHQA